MGEVMIPPWVQPVSPETWRLVDDGTTPFNPQFGRGQTQVNIVADPRWGLTRRYQGLRGDQLAAILAALDERRGQANVMRLTSHKVVRGSFPVTELYQNNTFANGTTGHTSNSETTLSSNDRVLRAVRNAVTSNQIAVRPSATIAVTAFSSYVARVMVQQGRGSYTAGFSVYDNVESKRLSAVGSFGLRSGVIIPIGATIQPGLLDESASGPIAGDYISIPYLSVARCPLVDNSPNAMTFSDQLDNAAWTKTKATITANTSVDPFGTSTCDHVVEDGTSGVHLIQQTYTRTAAAEDWVAYGFFKRGAGTRDIQLSISDGTGNSQCNFDLGAGTAGTPANASGVTNGRASIVSYGNGWYLCELVARLQSTTSATTQFVLLNAGSNSYLGNSTSSVVSFRLGGAASGLPVRPGQTTSVAAPTGVAQVGSALNVKGLPVSVSGTLEMSDYFEWGAELKRLISRVNTDAAGLGYLQFRPGLAGSPVDNDPIIVAEPFGRFMCASSAQEFENQFGIYGEAELELIERYNS